MSIEVTLHWHMDEGVQIYDNGEDGLCEWAALPARCPVCHERWMVVTAVGGIGAECPFCGEVDAFFVWEADDDDEPPLAGDRRLIESRRM